MSALSSTRMELLARKTQIKLAKQGGNLLEQKRAALMEELLRVANEVLQEASILEQTTQKAYQSLARANAFAGTEAVKSAALANYHRLSLDIKSANVIGVKIPVIEKKDVSRSVFDRGYAIIGTSIMIDETAADFEVTVTAIIQLARSELRLYRLIDEIKQTSRRLNALEKILIPRLESESTRIQVALDERERSDYFRIKLAKRALERS